MAELNSRTSSTGKPLQRLPWKSKDKKWFRENADYYISLANFNFGTTGEQGQRKDIRMFYEMYNNQFPMAAFEHITDPLSAKVAAHKSFPAKIRPVNILRTNIDLLLGEWPRRPFVYNIENLGESGYSSFQESLHEKLESNLTQHFIQGALATAQQSGQQLTEEQIAQLQKEPPIPEQVKTELHMSYKDLRAVKGQKWLRRQLREKDIRRKLHKLFKDWLLAGQVYSYKGVRHNDLVYRRQPAIDIDFDKSSENEMVEDGEWVVARRLLTAADLTDEYYDVLKNEDLEGIESKYQYSTPNAFYSSLLGLYTDGEGIGSRNKIPVYHVQWRGKKKIKILSYTDPETLQPVEEEVDEDFDEKLIPGATVEIKWPTEVYECTIIGGNGRIQDNLCVEYQAVPVQRNPMNGSGGKLNYNGKKYSDLHSDNVSVFEMGVPFQLLYIIVNYILEKTIAKSKGKILLFDQNTIPNEGDWDDEKFFYYSEAMGYALLNRNQVGVDKSWNQYQVVDMSLFENIKQLIELKDSIKQEWDDLIGVSRQRKGQTYSSDGQGVNERAVFQSTVITDMIFIGFEEFVEKELQGLLDFMKFTTSEGHKSVYNDDNMGTMLMEILPGEFTNEDLGVFLDNSSDHLDKLRKMQAFAESMIQNSAKPSTVMEVIDSINAVELKAKLRRIEEIEQQIAQQQNESEQDAQAAMEEIAQRHEQYKEVLKRETMEAEYDRKEDIEYIKGSFNTFTFADGDSNDNGVPDMAEVAKMNGDREKLMQQWDKLKTDRVERSAKLEIEKTKLNHQMEMDKAKLKQGDRKLKIDAKKAAQRPKTTSK